MVFSVLHSPDLISRRVEERVIKYRQSVLPVLPELDFPLRSYTVEDGVGRDRKIRVNVIGKTIIELVLDFTTPYPDAILTEEEIKSLINSKQDLLSISMISSYQTLDIEKIAEGIKICKFLIDKKAPWHESTKRVMPRRFVDDLYSAREQQSEVTAVVLNEWALVRAELNKWTPERAELAFHEQQAIKGSTQAILDALNLFNSMVLVSVKEPAECYEFLDMILRKIESPEFVSYTSLVPWGDQFLIDGVFYGMDELRNITGFEDNIEIALNRLVAFIEDDSGVANMLGIGKLQPRLIGVMQKLEQLFLEIQIKHDISYPLSLDSFDARIISLFKEIESRIDIDFGVLLGFTSL